MLSTPEAGPGGGATLGAERAADPLGKGQAEGRSGGEGRQTTGRSLDM